MVKYSEQFPERYFDVGIAEQHAVTFAAGLAADGMKPVVAIYSTFLQRAYDQLIHDVALQNLPVIFAIDRAGLVGADGPTHAGVFDLSYLRCVPNMTIMAPADENECRLMLSTAHQLDSPAAVRYPRGCGPGVSIEENLSTIEVGKSRTLLEGKKIALLGFGSMVSPALLVGKNINATVIDMRFVKPLDEEILSSLSDSYELIVTIEENVIKGGAGSAVNEYLTSIHSSCKVLNLGLPDRFIEHGDTNSLLADCGLDTEGIQKTILTVLPVPLAQSVESA